MRELCLNGITANVKKCQQYAIQSSQLVTVLSPLIGYIQAAELAQEALLTNKDLIQLVREKNLIPEEKIKDLFNPLKMTYPQ